MGEKYTQDLESALRRAVALAESYRHQYLTPEHLLLAFVGDPANPTQPGDPKIRAGIAALCPADALAKISHDVKELLGGKFGQEMCLSSPQEPQPSPQFDQIRMRAQKITDAANAERPKDQQRQVESWRFMEAMFHLRDSHAMYILQNQGIDRPNLVTFFTHGIVSGKPADKPEAQENQEAGAEQESFLEKFAVNLNDVAEQGKIDPLIGREGEVKRMVEIMCCRNNPNPMLVGEAGVGKTAIVEGLAQRIINGDVPEIIEGHTIYALDMAALVAGTKYRGDFEQRLKGVLKELKSKPKSMLFIDEIHVIMGAGAASGGTMDAANLLKPALARGDIKCVGATTFSEYKHLERDDAIKRRFQKIDVVEPGIEEAIHIVTGAVNAPQRGYAVHHGCTYTPEAIRKAVVQAKKHHIGFLPDGAFKIIDQAGAHQHVVDKASRVSVIDVSQIDEMVARIARIPEQVVSGDDKKTLRNLEDNMKSVVFGQDRAIESVAKAVKMNRSGLGDDHKPVGNFLFSGPTGVGKTEVARQLSQTLGIDLIRFDMSEYMERHAVSRLIGAPPGYVGFDQGGLLTEAIIKKPHCVLLLDEIEKAHSDIYNILLQVMDHGTLTDNNGRQADFRNVVLIMTTNAGAAALEKSEIGFTPSRRKEDSLAAIKREFSPEFRNRLDAIVPFRALDREIVLRVVDKFIRELQVKLRNKNIESEFTDTLRAHFAEKAFDPLMGARPARRTIQDMVGAVLADELLFGRLTNGGKVTVDFNAAAEELTFAYEAPENPPAPAVPEAPPVKKIAALLSGPPSPTPSG